MSRRVWALTVLALLVATAIMMIQRQQTYANLRFTHSDPANIIPRQPGDGHRRRQHLPYSGMQVYPGQTSACDGRRASCSVWLYAMRSLHEMDASTMASRAGIGNPALIDEAIGLKGWQISGQ